MLLLVLDRQETSAGEMHAASFSPLWVWALCKFHFVFGNILSVFVGDFNQTEQLNNFHVSGDVCAAGSSEQLNDV